MAKLAPYAFFQELDNNGDPLAGGKVYTYEAGTTTNKVTYTSEDESTANANPIILDAAGRADVWLDSGSYKLVITDSADVAVKTVDDVTGEASNVFGSSVVEVSTNTNITSVYQNNVIECTAALTLSLLDVATAEEGFIFSVTNTGAGQVVIDPDASELIDGSATKTIEAGQSLLVVCTGTAWITLFLAGEVALSDMADLAEATIIGRTLGTGTGIPEALDSDAVSAIVGAATTGREGVVELATTGEMSAGTSGKVPDASQVKFFVDTEIAAVSATLATPQASTSGTAFNFSGIPSTTTEIVVHFDGVSLSGTDDLLIQLGDAGGIETTGYISAARDLAGGVSVSSTAAFVVSRGISAAGTISGYVTINLMDSSANTWNSGGNLNRTDINPRINVSSGIKSLSDTLTQVTVTRDGTNTFDAGSINISYS